MKQNFKEETGAVLLIVVAFMAIVLFMMLFMFDLASLYVNSSRLQNVVDSAVEAGSGVVGEEIQRLAEERLRLNPDARVNDPKELLTASDRQKLAEQEIVYRVKDEMKKAATQNLDLSLPGALGVEFEFLVPAKNYNLECDSDSKYVIYAKAKMPIKFWFVVFKKITGKENTKASVDSLSYINLCF